MFEIFGFGGLLMEKLQWSDNQWFGGPPGAFFTEKNRKKTKKQRQKQKITKQQEKNTEKTEKHRKNRNKNRKTRGFPPQKPLIISSSLSLAVLVMPPQSSGSPSTTTSSSLPASGSSGTRPPAGMPLPGLRHLIFCAGAAVVSNARKHARNQSIFNSSSTSTSDVLTSKVEAIQALVNTARVQAGSQYAALESAVAYTTDLTAQYELGFNTVNDVNFSMETAHLAKNQILQQASTAMLAQANSGQQGLLQLIQG